jgi:hypothetical protein
MAEQYPAGTAYDLRIGGIHITEDNEGGVPHPGGSERLAHFRPYNFV